MREWRWARTDRDSFAGRSPCAALLFFWGLLLRLAARGGARNDIESLRRAVPLTRSDYLLEPAEPISQQMQTLGMAQWIPYFGTGVSGLDPYVFRSQMTPGVITTWDLRRKDSDTDAMRR